MVFLLFFTAVVLSGIAAYYSVIGLIAIFSAAALPVAVMGGSLEVAKLVVASWLYRYWRVIPALMKIYFTSALVILMLITSMGIFGFLSKAHSDQSLVSGDVLAKIALYDEKIKTARDNIEANRRALKQLDEAVDQVMARSTSEQGAERSVQIRRQQAPERQRLLKEIEVEQKKITALNEERAPIAVEVRKVEAEVGPIKYIAALIYGDNPETNLLERAVRWLIILLIMVFDPLAVLMLIAANLTQVRQKELQQNIEVNKADPLPDVSGNTKEETKNDDTNQYKIIPDQTVMPVAVEAATESGPQPTNTEITATIIEPATAPVEEVGIKKPPVKKSKKKVKRNIKKPKLDTVPASDSTSDIKQPLEQNTQDKSIAEGFIPKPLSIDDQVQEMINSNNQQGLEQVYKQIVKELAKKNRTKSTHWGPIKNTKNG